MVLQVNDLQVPSHLLQNFQPKHQVFGCPASQTSSRGASTPRRARGRRAQRLVYNEAQAEGAQASLDRPRGVERAAEVV